MRLEFHGDDELIRDFQRVMVAYPKTAKDSLSRVGDRFCTTLRDRVRGVVKSDKKLTKGFRVTGPFGAGSDLWMQFSGEGRVNPHWHLVEHGHELIRPNVNMFGKPYRDAGAHIGEVPGKEQIKALAESGEVDSIMESEMLTALDEALAEGNLK